MKNPQPESSCAQVTRRDFLKTTTTVLAAGAVLGALPAEGLAATLSGVETEAGAAQVTAAASASGAVGHGLRLLKGWEYRRGNLGGPWELWRKASDDTVTWQTVELPHCFNATRRRRSRRALLPGATAGIARVSRSRTRTRAGARCCTSRAPGRRARSTSAQKRSVQHVGGYDEFDGRHHRRGGTRALKRPDNKGLVPIAVLCDNSRDLRDDPVEPERLHALRRALPLREPGATCRPSRWSVSSSRALRRRAASAAGDRSARVCTTPTRWSDDGRS